jgi:hypothetical protein
MYSLKIEDGGSMVDQINEFNMLISQMGFIEDKIDEKDH